MKIVGSWSSSTHCKVCWINKLWNAIVKSFSTRLRYQRDYKHDKYFKHSLLVVSYFQLKDQQWTELCTPSQWPLNSLRNLITSFWVISNLSNRFDGFNLSLIKDCGKSQTPLVFDTNPIRLKLITEAGLFTVKRCSMMNKNI